MFALLLVRRSCFSGGEERSPLPHPQPAMHISSISTSASIKTCDTSVVLKLQCLKMQACSLVIISVQSSSLMDILGPGPLRSPHHGLATKLEKSNRFNRLNIWHKIFMFHADSRVKFQVRLHVTSYVRLCHKYNLR